MSHPPTFTCPECGATSAHPKDVQEGYCGHCHRWTRACNERPPEGHPMRDSGVACHLPQDHLDFGQPHSWDIDAAVARHEILTGALEKLRARFPDRTIDRFDVQLPHPIVAYDVDEHGERGRPYRQWDLPAGPWLVVTFKDPELAERRASAPEPIDNASLPAGAPMYYYCRSCGHQTAEMAEDWWEQPPPSNCDWCRQHDWPEYAIWKVTGAVYHVGADGAVGEDPILTLD